MRNGSGWRLGLGAISMIATLGFLVSAEGAQPQGTPLLITLPPQALATAEGANGFVIAGTFFSGGAFHWMPTSGVTNIGGRQAVAVSRDGKTIVGEALDQRGLENAAIWTGDETWRVLGSVHAAALPCDQLLSGAYGANDDGKVIVGLAWDGCAYARAFRWEESTGMVDLGSLGGGRQSTRANGVSGDGRVVVGWEEAVTGFRQGAKWVDGKEELIQGPAGFVGEAFAANRDGSIIAGTNCNPLDSVPPATGWTWTQTDGLKCYPVARPSWAPPRFYQVLMQKMSDDGRVIGGALSFGLDAESVVWFDGEAVFLRDYLRANGIPDAFDGWVNTGFVTDVSADGRTLVGYGAGPTTFTGFMVILPELAAK
jgi:probable HAF family extracellular repeat protein